ncbi:MAG: hypothetical protein HFG45_01290 [Oscillospiraceae bacterium]|nr:hypothetical protein [Oscillospiraceae bacterium]
MNQSRGNPITGALPYYFVIICCGLLTYTWGRRSFLADGNENIVVGMFVLYGVIVSLAVFSLRRSTYRKILEMEPKTYKKIVGSKGKQRPLEIYREKGERYSPPIEELIRTYNTFRLVGVVMIVISLAADALLLK